MKKVFCLVFALVMVFLCACSGDAGSGEKDTIVIAVNEDISGLDPFSQNTSLQNGYTLLNYDSLLALDPKDGKIIPGLAESYDIISATEYVFHLRSDVKFHEGQSLKASDVKFSIERAAASTGMASKVSQIDHVEVIDDSTVKFVLNTPSTTVLNNLAFCGTSIMCEEWCNANSSFKNNGTGPYKFVEWNPGESILMERNENYWGTPGATKYLKFVILPEDNARTIALETGEVDVDAIPATISYARYEDNADITLYKEPSTQVSYLTLSYPFEPVQNLDVRKAIAMAIDKQAMVDGFLDGYGYVKTTILGDGQQYCDNSIPEYKYDVEAAKALLAQAGYPDGFEMECLIRGEAKSMLASILQAQLNEIGITLTIKKLEGAAFTEACMNEQVQCTVGSWQPATSDADNPLRNILYSQSKASSNEARYNSPEYDAIIDAAIQETDPVKAQELYSQAQMKIYEDVALVPLFAHVWAVAANKDVTNVVIPVVGDALAYKYLGW